MVARTKRLFTNAGADATYIFDIHDDRATPGQEGAGALVLGTLAVGGTFDGASVAVTVQMSADGPNLAIEDSPITEAGAPIVFEAPFSVLTLAISGAGTSTSLTADFATSGPAVLVDRA